MPELPEVETTCRGIEPYLQGHTITQMRVHQPRLRWPVPEAAYDLQGQQVRSVTRRGKYILLGTDVGQAIIHLGMSGSLRISQANEALRKHDHVELQLDSGYIVRLHDPRRFGCFLWQAKGEPIHTLLSKLGPEPLTNEFNAEYLFKATRSRQVAIKVLIMNSAVVVGVGNIYASESLFIAGIRPGRAAKRISKRESELLVSAIKQVLQQSIEKGGTTLKDFVNSSGEPGYFQQSLLVYGREGEPCGECTNTIKMKVMGQRSTYYCSHCQH